MAWKTVQTDERDIAQKMTGWKIYCFTCKKDTLKSHLKPAHMGHEVDWVKKEDGQRLNV